METKNVRVQTGAMKVMTQIIAAGFLGLFFGILSESFRDVHERYGHLFLGIMLLLSLLTGVFFLSCARFYGTAAIAILALSLGGVLGWLFSKQLNSTWRKVHTERE